MIHNSGLYGQNDVPANMVVPGTVPRINAPLNMSNNLDKYTNAVDNASNTNYGQPSYSLMHQTTQFAPYISHTTSFSGVNLSSDLHQSFNSNSIPNTGFPLSNPPHIDYLNYPITKAWKKCYSTTNSFEQLPNSSSTIINIPQVYKNNTRAIENNQKDSNKSLYPTELLQDAQKNVVNDYLIKNCRVINKNLNKNISTHCQSKETLSSDTDNIFYSNANTKLDTKHTTPTNIHNNLINKEILPKPVTNSTVSIIADTLLTNQITNIKIEKEENKKCNDLSISDKKIVDIEFLEIFIDDSHGIKKGDVQTNRYNVYGYDDAVNIMKNERLYDANDSIFECTLCSLMFRDLKRFLIHSKWHNFGLKVGRKQLKSESRDATKSTPKIEKTDEKEGEGDIACVDCERTFRNKKCLRNHRQRYHKTQKECKICNKQLPTWKSLRSHVATVHVKDDIYRCSECPKTFKFARSLQKHQDTHLEKTHGCAHCDKKFGSALLLSIHSKTHTRQLRGTSHHCSYCGKGFYEAYTLAAHERTHRGERPYACAACDSAFGTNSGLKRHVKVSHSAAKPWRCAVCRRSFSTEAILARHALRAHEPARLPHACAACAGRYASARDLQKHCRKAHGKRRRRARDAR